MEQLEKNRVLVKDARGRPPTAHFKVSVTSMDGFRLSGMLSTQMNDK